MDLHWTSKNCKKDDQKDLVERIEENRKSIKALVLMNLPNFIRERGVGFFESLPKYKSLRGFSRNINPFTWINQCNSEKNFYSYYKNENPIISHDTAESLEFKRESMMQFEISDYFDDMLFLLHQ